MHRGCTAPCIWVNFSLKGSFMMSILLGQSYLFCFFMGKTKHEPARSGFGYWDSLKNHKDKSSYLILLFNTQSLPPCSTFMMSESPCPAGLSQSGKLDKPHPFMLCCCSLCSDLQELLLLPGCLAKIFFIPGPAFLSFFWWAPSFTHLSVHSPKSLFFLI